MNSVTLAGRLTKEVELRRTNTGKAVASFTLAIRRDKTMTDFINCVAWDRTAEVLQQYTHKGTMVGVEGRIQTRNYEDQQGKRNYVTEVVANRVELLESKPKEESQPQEQQFNILDDDLPF